MLHCNHMKNKTTTIIIIILIIIGVFVYIRNNTNKDVSSPLPTPVTTNDIKWSFDKVGDNSTKVDVRIHGTTYDVGTYTGTCTERIKTDLLENEISAVLCYFAGSGDEVGIFKDGKDYTIQVGEVQEPSAEGPAFRGNFRMLTVVK
jgi:hypothetical protein